MNNLNKFLFDESISLKAKGMYWLIWGMQEENEEHISLSSISKHVSDGQTSIRSAINELIEKGYLERTTVRNKNLITGYKYILK